MLPAPYFELTFMSDYIIKVENLSKKYRIWHQQEHQRYIALRDVIAGGFKGFGSRVLGTGRKLANSFVSSSSSNGSNSDHAILDTQQLAPRTEEFWALKDVSFEVKQGEVVGIIGRNGAGKSTLLKILSRITKPSAGRVRLRGRVASLLEVGTGFHPELTGRENIYLNGSVLGMTRAEIKKKFDEIVAFAEVEKFLDTPLKRYSSGMYVRLAFAVAAHLEPEILIVDEVLAVGDVQFQKRCLGKMGQVAEGGRTVLFVSHQMNQIRRLCGQCIWLDGGEIQQMGSAAEVVGAYEVGMTSAPLETMRYNSTEQTTARFLNWEILEPRNEQPNILVTMGPVTLRFVLKVNSRVANGHHGIALFNGENQLMWGTDTNNLVLHPGIHELVYRLPGLPLRPSHYFWQVSLFDQGRLVDMWDCIPQLVIATSPVTHSRDEWAGILNMPYDFSIANYSRSTESKSYIKSGTAGV